MAITIHQQPSSTLAIPVNNPIEYLVSSTNTSEENFKLSCKIVVGTSEVKELKYDVIPSTAYVIAEIQRLIEGYTSNAETSLFTSTGKVSCETDQKVSVRAVFQEWYSNPSSGDPSYQGSQSSGTAFYIYNGAFKYREWQNNEWQNYTIDGDPSVDQYEKILTAFSNSRDNYITSLSGYYGITNLSAADKFKKITPTQVTRLAWQCRDISNSKGFYVYFNFYDENFNVLSSSETAGIDQIHTNIHLSGVVNGFNVYGKNFDIDSMKTSSTWNFASNNLSAITSANIKYFSVYLRSPNYHASEAYLYEIDWDACSKYESYEIHWLNHLGGWDSWVFDKRSEKQVLVNRSNFTQPLTRRIESNTIIHDAYARKQKQFYTDISERFIVNSDILKDWEYQGLTDLLQSPLVYWRHPDYGFLAINIVDQDSYPIRTQLNDKSYNMSFTFEINNYDKLQGL